LDNKVDNFDSLQVDILREIANIGTGHAAGALGMLLGKTIIQSVPKVKLIPIYEMQDVLGGPEKVVVAGMLRLSGDISGYLLIIFNLDQADKIIALMMGKTPSKRKSERRRFSTLDKSVLNETFNIMSGSYLTAVASFTNMVLQQSIPFFCMDMVGAVLSTASAEIGKSGDYAIFFESELYSENEPINSALILIPDESSCKKLLESLGLV
jgi:chemotaxis protein CheC